MKRLRKSIQWLLLLSLFVSNMPLIYAEEINQAIKQGQAEETYKKSVTEASSQTVGSENANTEGSTSAEASSKPVKDGGDALQQPKVANGESKEEAELKKQYGAPVAVSGQEQLFRVDDTHFVTHIGSDIKTYIDKEGVEVPVDLSLYSYHANGKHYYLPKESPVGVVLPSEVKKETPIDITHKDDKISLYPLDKTYEQATVEKNAILYNNVDGKTDVQYTVQSNGVKEEIILAEWGGKNSFTYGLDASKYDVSLKDNQILVREKGETKILFVLTAPMMVDSVGATSNALTLGLKKGDGRHEVTVTASKEWLSDSERKYPVRIDPTVTVPREKILDIVTSSVHGQYQGYAYGYVGYMTAEMMGMAGVPGVRDVGRARMYFKINYDFQKSIPKEARIDSASLNIYEYTAPDSQSTQFAAYRLKQDFDINNLTWDTSVGLDMEIAGKNATSGKKIGMHNFDIRETVNAWVQGLEPNYGLVVAATDEGSESPLKKELSYF